MVAHNRRLKTITLEIDGIDVECQITEWKLNPPQNNGDLIYTFCPDGAFREEVDPDDWSLDLTWVTDWRTGGLNRHLWANQGDTVPFTLVEHPGVVGEIVTFAGSLLLAAPAVGGAARETEMSEITLLGVGSLPVPTYG